MDPDGNPPRPVHDLSELCRVFRLIWNTVEIAAFVYFLFNIVREHCE
jgi:hypothetical protein